MDLRDKNEATSTDSRDTTANQFHGWRENELREQRAIIQLLLERAKSGSWMQASPPPAPAGDAWQSAARAADALGSWAEPHTSAIAELEQKHTAVQNQLQQMAPTLPSGAPLLENSTEPRPSAHAADLAKAPGSDALYEPIIQQARSELTSLRARLRTAEQNLRVAQARIAGALAAPAPHTRPACR